jgi:hypothetical protein
MECGYFQIKTSGNPIGRSLRNQLCLNYRGETGLGASRPARKHEALHSNGSTVRTTRVVNEESNGRCCSKNSSITKWDGLT